MSNDDSNVSVGGVVTESGLTTLNASDLVESKVGSVLSTARSAGTGAPPTQLTDQTRVTVEGFETTLGQAVRMGYVERDGTGYKDANSNGTASGDWKTGLYPGEIAMLEAAGGPDTEKGKAYLALAGKSHPSEQPAPTESTSVPLSPASVQQLDSFAASLPSTVYDAAVSQAITRGFENVDLSAADANGQTREQMQAGISQVREVFAGQFGTYAASKGVNADEFAEWMRTEAKDEAQDAMRNHVASRNPAAYDALLTKYFANNAPSIDALASAGFETKTDRQHGAMVKIGGYWVTTKAAGKAGLV